MLQSLGKFSDNDLTMDTNMQIGVGKFRVIILPSMTGMLEEHCSLLITLDVELGR